MTVIGFVVKLYYFYVVSSGSSTSFTSCFPLICVCRSTKGCFVETWL